MRDAFGGTFMINLFLVFIIVYVCLTAMAVNYAKAFKVKNEVISYLEENEIQDLCALNAQEMMTMDDFFEKELVGKRGYSVTEYSTCETSGFTYNAENQCIGYCHPSGIEISQSMEAINTEGVYYTVSTYMSWGIPFMAKLSQLNGNNREQETAAGVWKISGQTRLIVSK